MSKCLSQRFVITKKCADRWDLLTVSCFYKAMFWKLHLLFITKGPLSEINSVLGGQQFLSFMVIICYVVTQARTVCEKMWREENMMNFAIRVG